MKKMSHRIALSVLSFFLVFAIVILVLVRINTNKMLEDVVEDKLVSESNILMELIEEKFPGDWSIKEGVLYKNNLAINDNNELVDSIKNLTGSHATIFLGDLRVATTAENEGNRAIGTKASTEVSKKVLDEGDTYIGTAEVVGENFNTIYVPFKGNDGSIIGMFFLGIPTLFQENLISTFTNTLLTYMAIIILLVLIGSYFLGQSLAKPITLAANHLEKMASLDISQDVPESFLNKKDEIGILAKSINKITLNLRDIIKNIGDSSEQVAATSEELTASSQQSAHASEEVSHASEDIAKGASEQATSTEEGTAKAILLGDIVEKNQEHMNNLHSVSNDVNQLVNEGLLDIENLDKITQKSGIAIKDIHDVILRTNDSSSKIEEASNVIASIADQTNLLALNAAIEAARAGEAGKGFAVVADEIRKLAEQSSLSTADINQIVNDLQINSQNAVELMHTVNDITNQQTNSVSNNKDKYTSIADKMKESEKALKILTESQKEIDNMKDEILNTLQGLSAIAEENSAATQEVSASMEEQYASTEEISAGSESLSQLAQDLQKIVQRIKL